VTAAAEGAGAIPRALTVLIAPDSFKGSLSSVDVARALAAGWARARGEDTILLAPLGDGGEGTIHAIEAAGGWTHQSVVASSPVRVDLSALWLRSEDGQRAYVELAEASGLSRVSAAIRSPMDATTVGTGQVLCAVLDAGIREITLGIGGSATTDGGAGILEAFGAVDEGDRVDLSGLDERLSEVSLEIACDVSNPLLGEHGAAATYGPQKGASPEQVAQLDARLAAWADRLEAATDRTERETPGAGAAGGTGFGLLAVADRFRSLRLRPGVELVMEAAGFDDKLGRADLVLTGEGRIDAQTAFGKTALGVARRAAKVGRPCIAVGGGVEREGIAALGDLGVTVVSVAERPGTVEEAMSAGAAPVEQCGERLARLIGLGVALGAESRA
jgi:glycerate kinase